MTDRDDTLKQWAQRAGFVRERNTLRCHNDGSRDPILTTLARFAALVRADATAKAYEACAQEFDRREARAPGVGFYDPDEPAQIVRALARNPR